MDKKDQQILDLLINNSRQSWKTIGNKIYLSGQAVGHRIEQLQYKGIIEKFTVAINHPHLQFITIYMDTNQFDIFETLVCSHKEVLSMDKITGDGCYFINSCFTPIELEKFITKISHYARYKINHRLKSVK